MQASLLDALGVIIDQKRGRRAVLNHTMQPVPPVLVRRLLMREHERQRASNCRHLQLIRTKYTILFNSKTTVSLLDAERQGGLWEATDSTPGSWRYLRLLASVSDDDNKRWFLDRAGSHFTKAKLMPETKIMKICEREVVRFLHVLFCSVILVLRLSLMFVAVSIRGRLFHFNAFLYDYVTVLAFYLICSSCAYMLLGIFGIHAAVPLRRWKFVTYSAILAFLYLVEVLLFGIAFNKWLILNVTVEESMDYHISNYRTNPHDIDYVQKALKCCGKYREDEWFDAIAYIPASCCPSRPPTDTQEFCSLLPPDIYYIIHNTGCLRQLQDIPNTGLAAVTYLLICLCAVEVLSFCVSTYAARWTLLAAPTKTATNTKEYEGTNTLPKITYIYNGKHINAKSAEASVQCIFLRPIACEERNSFIA